MPREFALGDIYVPTLLLVFLLTVVLNWGVNWGLSLLLAKLGWSRHIWHPALFHLALFVCLFASIALTIYQ